MASEKIRDPIALLQEEVERLKLEILELRSSRTESRFHARTQEEGLLKPKELTLTPTTSSISVRQTKERFLKKNIENEQEKKQEDKNPSYFSYNEFDQDLFDSASRSESETPESSKWQMGPIANPLHQLSVNLSSFFSSPDAFSRRRSPSRPRSLSEHCTSQRGTPQINAERVGSSPSDTFPKNTVHGSRTHSKRTFRRSRKRHHSRFDGKNVLHSLSAREKQDLKQITIHALTISHVMAAFIVQVHSFRSIYSLYEEKISSETDYYRTSVLQLSDV